MSSPAEPLLDIVYAGSRYVVVNKPTGMLSVPGRGPLKRDCVIERVRQMFSGATGPITVHRLDMDTSGLLVCALDADAQRDLAMQFERREIAKRYLALVEGVVEAESGTIDVPVRADPLNRPYQVIDRSHRKPATTAWKLQSIETDRSRVELIPLTGRTHQLRVHCAMPGGLGSRGHPIVGDILYGNHDRDAERLMLHAWTIELCDPETGRRRAFCAEVRF